RDRGGKEGRLYGAMNAQAIAMKADHAIELAETQGLGSIRLYFENMEKDTKTKADVQFLKHAKVQEAIQLAEATEVEHPKLAKTGWIVRKQLMEKADSKVIVFAHYRQTADRLTKELARIPSVQPMRFAGQAGRGVSVQRPREGTEDARGARPPPEGFEAEDLRGRTGRRNVRGRGSGKADRDVAGAVPRSSSGPGIPPTSLEERPDDLRR